jgi:hypothetical protein
LLDLLADGHAPPAEDAFVRVPPHGRVGFVDSRFRLLSLKAHFADPQFLGQLLQLAFAVLHTDQAILRMRGKQQLHRKFAGLVYFLGIRMNHQPFCHGKNAGSLEVSVPFDFDQAYPARADGLDFRQIAQGGNADIGRLGRIQDGCSRGNRHMFSVDGQANHAHFSISFF